ncbi:geranyl-CoA carboxylase alpha subunit [Sinobacterium caligoides]|uniref:Biotin carboxylase n=1 Tax=Sinobacterium caligoides TaxID=933926 RepID=A0A3N2DPL5_9GAMM|nr:biotin carboxylase N-terminal domain-containing protein [Sinobacterium caligoides]ROS01736.1 geranyl-CoA carboxylase alpha subunit [Sinobacterium caligoides]
MSRCQPFTSVLVANRGEIALRVIESAKQQGYRTVALYSPVDADSPHVAAADSAVRLEGNSIDASYLNIEQVFAAARASAADAIHPGYGFFSENAEFAERCADEGIVFIGPSAASIVEMGSKRQAKLKMIAAGVPCIPGYEGAEQSNDELLRQAEAIGWPVMIKASAGGGGRGMRLVDSADSFIEQLAMARSEALNAFGNDEIILEKALVRARHIEVQVFGDRFGNAVYLGERDCSLQRRHQKVVEEAPSPAVDETLRQAMGEAAVRATKACDYIGAGTIEFLLDADGAFYFLEMNTRLQVEHPVTEWVTGLDLVAWQLQVAAGHALPKQQHEIGLSGHAIEVRLYAEDPAQQFMPQTGVVDAWLPAANEGLRIDAGISAGQPVSPYYDPMLAKLIAFGEDREMARRRLLRALQNSVLTGVRCNQSFLARLLQDPVFIAGEATTDYIDHQLDLASLLAPAEGQQALAQALAAVFLASQGGSATEAGGWSNGLRQPHRLLLQGEDDSRTEISVSREQAVYCCQIGEQQLRLRWQVPVSCAAATYRCRFALSLAEQVFVDAEAYIHYVASSGTISVSMLGDSSSFHDVTLAAPETRAGAASGRIVAPMDGSIYQLLVEQGERVSQGQTLAILEAMKMEHPLKADCDGVVEAVQITQGEQVSIRQTVIVLSADE